MHYAFMDRIKQCYADEIEIYHTTTMIIEYDRSCAIINALLAWARPSMFYILLVKEVMIANLIHFNSI